MARLADLLLAPATRPKVVDDCVRLIDEEVDHKSGLTGLAVKGAYAVVKAVKPGIIREAVDRLLDAFVGKLEPFHDAFAATAGKDFASYLAGRSADVSNALLGVTDARAARADHGTIKKAYAKLRPSAQKHVEAAVPGIGRVVQRYLS